MFAKRLRLFIGSRLHPGSIKNKHDPFAKFACVAARTPAAFRTGITISVAPDSQKKYY